MFLFQLGSENLEVLESLLLLFIESPVHVLLLDLLLEIELELADFHSGTEGSFHGGAPKLEKQNDKVVRTC